MNSLLGLLLGAALCTGGFIVVARVAEFIAKLAGSTDPLEDAIGVLFFGMIAIGAVAPPIAILWMAIA